MTYPARTSHEERVEFIRGAMAGGAWTKAVEHRMMREWSVTAGQMVRSIAEARGTPVTKAAPVAPGDIRGELVERLRTIVQTGEDRDSIKAADSLAKLLGANAPEIDIRQHMLGMPSEERRAYCERLRDMCVQVLESIEELQ
jgi:hypothetical protein